MDAPREKNRRPPDEKRCRRLCLLLRVQIAPAGCGGRHEVQGDGQGARAGSDGGFVPLGAAMLHCARPDAGMCPARVQKLLDVVKILLEPAVGCYTRRRKVRPWMLELDSFGGA